MIIPLWAIYALLSALFGALVAVFAKLGFVLPNTIDNTVSSTIRAIIMALFLILFCLVTKKEITLSNVDNKALLYISLSAIVGAISWLFYFLAIEYAPFTKIPAVTAIDRLSVIFVFIFTIFLIGLKPSIYSTIGALFIIFGTILMSTY